MDSGTPPFFLSHVRATGSILDAAWSLLAHLTDWATLLVAIVCTGFAAGRRPRTPVWWLCAMAGTLLAGALFAALGGWSVVLGQGVSSTLAHVVVPAAMLILWLLLPHGGLRWRAAAALPLSRSPISSRCSRAA